MNKDIKNIGKLFGMAAYVLASIGGFGVACKNHSFLIAIAIVALAAMAWPTFKKMWPKKEA